MSAATIIANAFGEGACLYETVLEVPRNATLAQLRKAYYKKALLYHPDKTAGQEAKFQAVNVAYEILKDADKRAEYDESGELWEGDECNETNMEAWKSYFSHVFGSISTSDIDTFAAKYKCSAEEEADVLKEYTKFKGNLMKMLDHVMLSEARDCERWVEDYIRPAVEKGTVTDYSKTLEKTLKQAMVKVKDDDVVDGQETESDDESDDGVPVPKKPKSKPVKKKKSKQQKEAEAAKELMAKIQGKNSVAKRKAGFEAMFAKYGAEEDPLAGQDFDALRAEMQSRKKKRAKK
mmetsp:Transcript_7062/g.12969  ORF Transcript_7062/g.12969 Transcript_7062/m.12969 type:complete len:292 (+) Transcript_7062:50-925(+)